MNNEEQIISMLTSLTATVSDMKQDFGQRLDKLEAGQAKLEARVEDIHDTLAKLEVENEQAHGAIFDKLDILETRTDTIAEDVSAIKERLDTDEVYIRIFDKKLRQT